MHTLALGALHGLRSDGAPALPVLIADGADARAELVAEGGARVGLTPGVYFFELHARGLEGNFAPRLVASVAGGGEAAFEFAEVAPGFWRAVIDVKRSVEALTLTLAEACRFVFAGATIDADAGEQQDTPTIRRGAVTMARAAFRKLPQGLRRAMLASERRARWLQQVRNADQAPESDATGARVTTAPSGDANSFRADFENRMAAARNVKEPSFTEAAPEAAPRGAAKLIAFHLPQFHPIPENDAWWGKGFTEWSNVAKAAPQFVGHYQPRLPGELGFYDLRTPGALANQAKLARAYGVEAFCFHYYWFAGKRLLEAPLESFLADRSIDIEFCLCWANESWTRRWDGDENQVLMAQSHSPADHARVFDDLARHMDDPRYLRIDGKPVLVVYRPAIIADARAMTDMWREAALKRGWKGLYFIASNAFRFDDPARLGFDALVEFPPHGFVADSIASRLSWHNASHAGAVFDYAAVAASEAKRMASARGDVFPGVMPGWDNEARRPGAGVIYHGSTPEAYGEWLAAAIARAARSLPADRRFVFINAWNEWAEGAYLEPDRAFGRAYLAETARVLSAS